MLAEGRHRIYLPLFILRLFSSSATNMSQTHVIIHQSILQVVSNRYLGSDPAPTSASQPSLLQQSS